MPLVSALKRRLTNALDPSQRLRLRQYMADRFRWPQHLVFRTLFGRNLRELALVYGTDKWGDHWYAKHYERHFSPFRRQQINLLEIGIGGGPDTKLGGGSLRMWRTYFPKGRVFGIDIFDKSHHNERRITTLCGSQVDFDFLEDCLRVMGAPDIVIDDGSHRNEHVIATFKYLFPRLRANGLYVIEDTQTSYWQEMGGSSSDFNRRDTSMGFIKSLVDGLNFREFDLPEYEPTYFDQHIVAMHFYHSIVFIEKGNNYEESSARRWRRPERPR